MNVHKYVTTTDNDITNYHGEGRHLHKYGQLRGGLIEWMSPRRPSATSNFIGAIKQMCACGQFGIAPGRIAQNLKRVLAFPESAREM
jgi:hypothetical protein